MPEMSVLSEGECSVVTEMLKMLKMSENVGYSLGECTVCKRY
jgi:hypothetical protein